MEKAIALLEVQALTAAIEGLDAMLKAANVRLVHVEKRLGGRLVIYRCGIITIISSVNKR